PPHGDEAIRFGDQHLSQHSARPFLCSGRLDTGLDTPPSINRRHLDSRLARASVSTSQSAWHSMNNNLFAIWWPQAVRRWGRLNAMRKAPAAWLTLRRMRWPRVRPTDGLALLSVLHSGNWGGWPSPNRQASRFADRFASMHDAAHGICTSSGTTALQIVYR